MHGSLSVSGPSPLYKNFLCTAFSSARLVHVRIIVLIITGESFTEKDNEDTSKAIFSVVSPNFSSSFIGESIG